MRDTAFKDYQYEKGIEYVWVVGTFEGERAKSVLAHANASGSYIILDQSGNKFSPACTAAFIYAGDGPVPHHLLEVRDPIKIAEYEQKRHGRQ